MKDQLTSKQQQVLDYIKKKIAGNMPPTVREIAGEFGIKSPNGVACHLRALEKKGHITRNQHVSRGIRLVAEDKKEEISVYIGESVVIGDVRISISNIDQKLLTGIRYAELQITHPDSMEVKNSDLLKQKGFYMLIVTRRTDESVIIETPDGSEIVITPCKCRNGRVKLGIVAPQEYVIRRDNMIQGRGTIVQELQNEEVKG